MERFNLGKVLIIIFLAMFSVALVYFIIDELKEPPILRGYSGNVEMMTKDGALVKISARITLLHGDKMSEDEIKWLFLYGVNLMREQVIEYNIEEICLGHKGNDISDSVCDMLRKHNANILWDATYHINKQYFNRLDNTVNSY